MKVVILYALLSIFNVNTSQDDECTVTIIGPAGNVTCTAAFCHQAKACAIAGYEGLKDQ